MLNSDEILCHDTQPNNELRERNEGQFIVQVTRAKNIYQQSCVTEIAAYIKKCEALFLLIVVQGVNRPCGGPQRLCK